MLPVHVPEAWLSGICEFLTGKQRSSHLDLFSLHLSAFRRDLTCWDRSLGGVDNN